MELVKPQPISPCSRCSGLLVILTRYDHEQVFFAARCMNCGHQTDTTMQRNKAQRPVVGWDNYAHHQWTGKESRYDAGRNGR